jgi:hypothetical protein
MPLLPSPRNAGGCRCCLLPAPRGDTVSPAGLSLFDGWTPSGARRAPFNSQSAILPAVLSAVALRNLGEAGAKAQAPRATAEVHPPVAGPDGEAGSPSRLVIDHWALDIDYCFFAVPTGVYYRYHQSGAGAVMSRLTNLATSFPSPDVAPQPSPPPPPAGPTVKKGTHKIGVLSPEIPPEIRRLSGKSRTSAE